MTAYHDNEWGVPLHDDRKLFEFLILDIFQAGLSWRTVLNKRENFRKAFDDFDYEKIALYQAEKIEALLADKTIIRNRAKIIATITNARKVLAIRKESGSFSDYLWSYVNNRPVQNDFESLSELPSKTELSVKISKDLAEKGFKFVGPTIIYAFMQSMGMVNDHLTSCFRHSELSSRHSD